MAAVTYVLDAGAATLYANGDIRVTALLLDVHKQGDSIVVPSTCLAEAYSKAEAHHLAHLDVLRDLGCVTVTPLTADDTPMVGAAAKHTGSSGMGHAVIEALTYDVSVVTDAPADARRALRDTHIEPL